jgi:hypothetical protein
MINTWEIILGIFTVIFFLGSFYFLAKAGIREYGKRGALIFSAVALLGTGFIFDLIGEVYENETAELISHGAVIMAGLMLLLSFYLSNKEFKREGASPK